VGDTAIEPGPLREALLAARSSRKTKELEHEMEFEVPAMLSLAADKAEAACARS
jgi:hypothetical protein